MALSRNIGNLLGRVASNHITQEISSSKTSITQAINLGRVAIASNHVPQKISPPFVERVTVEASDDQVLFVISLFCHVELLLFYGNNSCF